MQDIVYLVGDMRSLDALRWGIRRNYNNVEAFRRWAISIWYLRGY